MGAGRERGEGVNRVVGGETWWAGRVDSCGQLAL